MHAVNKITLKYDVREYYKSLLHYRLLSCFIIIITTTIKLSTFYNNKVIYKMKRTRDAKKRSESYKELLNLLQTSYSVRKSNSTWKDASKRLTEMEKAYPELLKEKEAYVITVNELLNRRIRKAKRREPAYKSYVNVYSPADFMPEYMTYTNDYSPEHFAPPQKRRRMSD